MRPIKPDRCRIVVLQFRRCWRRGATDGDAQRDGDGDGDERDAAAHRAAGDGRRLGGAALRTALPRTPPRPDLQ